MRTNNETPFYIRTREGQTFYVENLDEAIDEFISEEGYRLTLEHSNGTQVVMRRAPNAKDDPNGVHNLLGEIPYNATVIIIKNKK